MAVAPSFESLEKIMPPFIENGREYIYVICKNGNKRKVRWYSDKEREKLDMKKSTSLTVSDIKPFEQFNAHDAFGFGEEDFITIYVADEEIIKEWRTEIPPFSVLENSWFGYYSPSYFTGIPPQDVRSIILYWSEIQRSLGSNSMKDGDWVRSYVNEKIYGQNNSKYQGQKDDWLTHAVIVKKNITTETHYGETHIHILEDVEGNQYVWTTASKNLEEGCTYILKMKVKEHKEYKGVKQTVVYYCKVLEEQ